MAEPTSPESAKGAPVATTSESDFLKSSSSSENTNVYGDFFQETSDGNLSIGPKAQKSGLEILTTMLGYIVPVVIIIVILGIIHVFIRTRDDSSFAENYSFLCPYLNYGINDEGKACKTMTSITKEYQDKTTDLQNNIIEALTEYIPIKISKNIIDASPEKKFIIETFSGKVRPDDVMKQFDSAIQKAQYSASEKNIECNGINIVGGNALSTQCTVYGGSIGDDDTNGKLGSARIMALRFTDVLANTIENQFILMNPPTTLSIEKIEGGAAGLSPNFKTRVTIPVQLQYVPLEQKS